MAYRPDRPLVWFLHFHKAGGSSVVELARREGLVFPPLHANGNALTPEGKFERPWELSADGLAAWTARLRRGGTQFVATEWGVPDLDTLTALPDVRVVAVLRDPVDRVVSNFRFDRRQGFTAAADVLAYLDHHVDPFTWSDFQVRQILGPSFVVDADPDALVAEAVRRMQLVHRVSVLGDPGWLEHLADALGWTYSDVHVNRLRRDLPRRVRNAQRLAVQGRLDVARRALRPDVPVSEAQRAVLAERNVLDRRLAEAFRTAASTDTPAP